MSDTPRKPLTKREHVDLLLAQGGRCAICKNKFKAGEPRVEEHSPPRALLLANGVPAGEVDGPKYRSIVCAPCAGLKTRGKVGESDKHSVANGDTHTIQKAKRRSIARLPKAEIEQLVGDDPGYRLKKKLDGSVVRVRTK